VAFIICDNPEYVKAGRLYAEKLEIPKDTIISIHLHEELDVSGFCNQIDQDEHVGFIIGLNTDETIDCPFMVLAHEMVHVKQYVTGDLVDSVEGMCFWKNKCYPEYDVDNNDYYFTPWEVEAYGLMYGLHDLYMRSLTENELH